MKKEIRILLVIFLNITCSSVMLFSIKTKAFNICVDPGHGFSNAGRLNGWHNHGPTFDVNDKPFYMLKKPKESGENVMTALSTPVRKFSHVFLIA